MKKAYKREEKGRNLHKFVVKSSIDEETRSHKIIICKKILWFVLNFWQKGLQSKGQRDWKR